MSLKRQKFHFARPIFHEKCINHAEFFCPEVFHFGWVFHPHQHKACQLVCGEIMQGSERQEIILPEAFEDADIVERFSKINVGIHFLVFTKAVNSKLLKTR